jgi:uncharacterized protein YdhG (YjbR/CyaY superfamily)
LPECLLACEWLIACGAPLGVPSDRPMRSPIRPMSWWRVAGLNRGGGDPSSAYGTTTREGSRSWTTPCGDYIDAIAPQHRPLFDRLHRLVLEAHPDATVVLSYQMPTYKVGRRRLFLGVWQHGVSIYGFEHSGDAGFTARHPELKAGKGTIRLRPEDAVAIADDEFRDLVRAVLDG